VEDVAGKAAANCRLASLHPPQTAAATSRNVSQSEWQ